jgi:hypothetical protein
MVLPERNGLIAEADRLERSLRLTANLLRTLLAGLQQRRTAWISARPSRLAPSPELDQTAGELAAEDRRRAEILRAIRALVPPPAGAAADDLHLDVTFVAAMLPAPAARSLRQAGDETTALARAVRAEVALGQRLLRFSQQAQDGLLRRLAGTGAPDAAAGYDRNARARRGIGLGDARATLIDGRV